MRQAANFGGIQVSTLTKRVLIALVALYMFQVIAESWLGLPIIGLLAWQPWGAGFMPWQPLTCYLVNGPAPLSALLDWLVLFFFLTPIEHSFGQRGLVRITLFSIAISAILGVLLSSIGAVSGTFLGLTPLLTALIVLFGLSRPNAQILLFFVLPIRASWIAWGTGLVGLLSFLYGRSLSSTMVISGWLAGYLWIEGQRRGGLKRMLKRWQHKRTQDRVQRQKSRFTVIDGDGQGQGRRTRPPDGSTPWGRPPDDDDSGPMIH